MNKSFKTSFGREIPGHIMAKVVDQLAADKDWQDVATYTLRPFIPDHDDDLSEVNEVLTEAEERLSCEIDPAAEAGRDEGVRDCGNPH